MVAFPPLSFNCKVWPLQIGEFDVGFTVGKLFTTINTLSEALQVIIETIEAKEERWFELSAKLED